MISVVMVFDKFVLLLLLLVLFFCSPFVVLPLRFAVTCVVGVSDMLVFFCVVLFVVLLIGFAVNSVVRVLVGSYCLFCCLSPFL